MSHRWSLVLTLALSAAPALSQGNPPPTQKPVLAPTGRILGVFDMQTGVPIEGVEVVDMMNGTKSLTTKTGTVSLFFLPEGGSFVRVRKLGYQPQTFLVATGPVDTLPITVVMEHATELPAVVTTEVAAPNYISPRLKGFEERRKIGLGHYITEAELRKEDGRLLENILLSKIAGIRILPTGEVYSNRMCAPDVYVDGMRGAPPILVTTYRNGQSSYSIHGAYGTDFAAVEYYTLATTPAEFATIGHACGVLLLWTRER